MSEFNVMVRMDADDWARFNLAKRDLKAHRNIKPANGEVFLILLRDAYPEEQTAEVASDD